MSDRGPRCGVVFKSATLLADWASLTAGQKVRGLRRIVVVLLVAVVFAGTSRLRSRPITFAAFLPDCRDAGLQRGHQIHRAAAFSTRASPAPAAFAATNCSRAWAYSMTLQAS